MTRRKKLASVCVVLAVAAAAFLAVRFRPEPDQAKTDQAKELPAGVAPVAKQEVPESAPNSSILITGRVVAASDDDDQPSVSVEGATVRLRGGDEAAVTGTDGRFELSVTTSETELTLEIDAPSFVIVAPQFEITDEDKANGLDLGEIALRRATTLVVQLSDSDDQAIADAKVQAEDYGSEGPPQDARNEGGGRFVFERLWPGYCEVTVQAPGYVPVTTDVDLPTSDPLAIRLVVPGTIAGFVRATNGDPIPGARVHAPKEREPDAEFGDTRSDGSGRFALHPLDPSVYQVVAEADGYASDKKRLVTGTDDAEFRLLREAVISGRVISVTSGTPVAGASVRGECNGSFIGSRTDSLGRFEIKSIRQGTWSLDVWHREHVRLDGGSWELREGQHLTELVFRLDPGCSLHGKVIAAATGQGISGALVRGEGRETRAGIDGSFKLLGLTPGTYTVAAGAPGFVEYEGEAAVTQEESAEHVIRLLKVGFVSGRVVSRAGDPVGGAVVRLVSSEPVSSVSDSTNATGRYVLSGLPPGHGYVLAAYDDSLAGGVVRGIDIEEGQRLEGIDIVLDLGTPIRGRVTEEGGDGVRARVWLKPQGLERDPLLREAGDPGPVTCSEDGAFEVTTLWPGAYEIEASFRGRVARETMDVRGSGVPTAVDLVLPPGGAIEGRVVDSSGAPIAGAEIWVLGELLASTRLDGSFRIAGLLCDVHEVDFDCEGFALKTLFVRPPCQGLTVVMERLARIEGQVRYGELRSFPIGSVGTESGTDSSGRFSVTVAPGAVFLVVEIPGFADAEVECVVQPGETKRVIVPLRRRGEIRGTVMARGTLEPVEDAEVFMETDGRTRCADSFGARLSHEDGSFSIEGAPEGRASLVARGVRGLGRTEVNVRAGDAIEAVIEIEEGSGIFGSVGQRWDMIRGREVVLRGSDGSVIAKTVTCSRGFFDFKSLSAGEYTVTLEPRVGGAEKRLEERVTVEAGKYTHVGFLVLDEPVIEGAPDPAPAETD